MSSEAVSDDEGRVIEPARSGRSRCRACRQPIPQGTPRFGMPSEAAAFDLQWYHLRCAVGLWPKAVLALVDRYPGLGEIEDSVRARAKRLAIREVALEPAVDAARKGDWAVVAEVLCEAWWSTREPRIARLLSELTHAELERRGPIPTGQAWSAFMEGLDRDDALERGLWIVGAGRATKGAMPEYLSEGIAGPPDPRWVDLLVPWLGEPPWQNAPSVWAQAFRLLDRLADPRMLPALDELRTLRRALASRFGWDGAYELERWVQGRDDAWFAAQHDGMRELGPIQIAALDAVSDAIERMRGQRAERGRRLEELYAAAGAGDDDALAVLADHLLADDDIRGEYIQLCLAGDDRAASRRMRALERQSWRELLGALAPVVRRRDLVLERGLPVHVVAASRKPADVAVAREAYEWASVRSLELAPPAGGSEGVIELVTPRAVCLSEISAVLGPERALRLLFAADPIRSVRRVVVHPPPWRGTVRQDGPLGPLRFPALEELVVPADWPMDLRRTLRDALPGVRIELHRPARRR